MPDKIRPLSELRGMRYPDEYVIRMFFKEQLHQKPGSVLELGCGSGNNLLLFQGFGWSTTGIDISAGSLDDASHNLGSRGVHLIQADLSNSQPDVDGEFDCILLASVNYYVPRKAFIKLLTWLRPKLRPGGVFYIRSRLVDDWRFGRGTEVEPNGYQLTCSETGERGLLNVFYSADELSDLLATHGNRLDGIQRLSVRYDNPQGGMIIGNSDVVIWGRREVGNAL